MLTWLLSYLAVLLLPLIISIFVYVVAGRMLGDEIREANSSMLKQVQEMMDNYFQAMERLNYELTWNVRVQDLLFSNKYLSHPEEYNYDLYRVSQDLKPYQSAYSLVDQFYIYLNKGDTVILPGIVREGREAYELLHASGEWTYSEWKATVGQKDVHGFLPMNRIDNEGKLRRTVAYVSSFTMDKEFSPAANVIMVDEERILGLIRNVELFNKGHVFILNEQNQVLVGTSAGKTMQGLPFARFTDPSHPLREWTGPDGHYQVMAMSPGRSGLRYVSMIPSKLYWEKATLVRNLTIASSIASLLGGVLLTTFFLRRNYNPLRSLLQAVSGKTDLPLPRGGNEFQQLQQAMDRTFSKLDTMTAQIERQRHLVRSHFIARLLKGRTDASVPIDESLAAFSMTFASDSFAVILLYIEPSETFYERLPRMDPGESGKLLQFIVSNVAEELASQRNAGYVAEVDDALACLVNFKPGADDSNRSAELMRIASESQRFLAEAYGIQLTLAVSGIHRSVSGIAQAYMEAMDAMEYKLVMGSKEILSYEQLYNRAGEDNGLLYYYPLQTEQQLINYAKVGDFEKAKQTLDDIIAHNFMRGPVSVPIARCLMLNLVSTMVKTVSEIGALQESFLVQQPRRIERLARCATVHEMQARTTAFLRDVCEYTAGRRLHNLQQTRRHTLDRLMEQVKSFIADRYADPNLNITWIGHHFEMKPTYLSKLFKDYTGEGLLDCINKTRVERAKRLIAGDRRNVSDVAGCVGFNDVNSFIRTFKKYEGITPGKFKELSSEASS